MVRVKALLLAPGGRYAGLNEAVASLGSPVAASAMGLESGSPCMATENAKLAALPKE